MDAMLIVSGRKKPLFGLDCYEKSIVDKLNPPYTPDAFRKAVGEALPQGAVSLWERYLVDVKAKSWKGFSLAAKSAVESKSIFLSEYPQGSTVIEDAINAIYGIIPAIALNTALKRSKSLEEWDAIGFCRLCWRLAPAGQSKVRRQPLCHFHDINKEIKESDEFNRPSPSNLSNKKPKTNEEYVISEHKKFVRLSKLFKEERRKIVDSISDILFFCQELMDKLPYVSAYVKKLGGDISSIDDIVRILLLDIPEKADPKGKIRDAAADIASNCESGFLRGTLIYAEACLSVLAKHPYGGKRTKKDSAPKNPQKPTDRVTD